MSDISMSRPGDVGGWPKLTIRYLTDPANIAALLPPGIKSARVTVEVILTLSLLGVLVTTTSISLLFSFDFALT